MLQVSPRADPVKSVTQHKNTHSVSTGLQHSAPAHLECGLAGLQLSPQLADLLGGGLPHAAQAGVQCLHVLRQLQDLPLLGAELHLQVGARQHLQGRLRGGGEGGGGEKGPAGAQSEHKGVELVTSAEMYVFLTVVCSVSFKKNLEVMYAKFNLGDGRWRGSSLDRTSGLLLPTNIKRGGSHTHTCCHAVPTYFAIPSRCISIIKSNL